MSPDPNGSGRNGGSSGREGKGPDHAGDGPGVCAGSLRPHLERGDEDAAVSTEPDGGQGGIVGEGASLEPPCGV